MIVSYIILYYSTYLLVMHNVHIPLITDGWLVIYIVSIGSIIFIMTMICKFIAVSIEQQRKVSLEHVCIYETPFDKCDHVFLLHYAHYFMFVIC